MSYSEEVKQLAYKIDPECWVSYSGCAKAYKRAMDTRRNLSLEAAKRYVDARGLAKAAHRLQAIVDHQIDLTNAIGDNPFLLYFEKDSGKAVPPPKKHTLHGRELKVGSEVIFGKKLWRVTSITIHGSVSLRRVEGDGGATVGSQQVEGVLSWPKEAPDTQAELRHYYDTVITDMCKGTAVNPWECVRFTGPSKEKAFSARPGFNLVKSEYEFALTVHLNRPVWVGSVLYDSATGEELRVVKLNVEGKLVVKLRGGVNVTIRGVWQGRLSWEKPVKQKAPTRVKVGHDNYVTVPEQITGKGTARLVLDFGSNRDAAEFYEVFKNLTGEKKA